MSSDRPKVDAVILAGGTGEVIDPSCRFKGLLPIAGRPLVEWVLDAFLSAKLVGEIAVVMPTAEGLGPWVDKGGKLVVSDREFMDNVLAGLSAFRDERRVLVATGDIPMLTGEAIDDFVSDSLATGADFTYPIIPREEMEEEFPGSVRTYFRLKTGRFTGGNMMIVNPLLAPGIRDLGQQLFEERKNPVGMLKIAGLGFVVKFIAGRLDPDDLAKKIEELVGGSAAAVLCHQPSLAVDVDKPADRDQVESLLAGRGAGNV